MEKAAIDAILFRLERQYGWPAPDLGGDDALRDVRALVDEVSRLRALERHAEGSLRFHKGANVELRRVIAGLVMQFPGARAKVPRSALMVDPPGLERVDDPATESVCFRLLDS